MPSTIHILTRGHRRIGLNEVAGRGVLFENPITTGLLMQIDVPGGGAYKDTARTTSALMDGDVVMGVTDSSGNANHWAQSDSGVAPTFRTAAGGQKVLRFPSDGAHYMSFTSGLANIRTIYWVINEDPAYGGGYQFMLGHNINYDFHATSPHGCFDAGFSKVNLLHIDKANVAVTTNRPTTLKVVTGQTSSNASATEFSRDRGNGFGARSWCGDLCMLLIYSAVHDATQMDTMETALKGYCSV